MKWGSCESDVDQRVQKVPRLQPNKSHAGDRL